MKLIELKKALSVLSDDSYVCLGVIQDGGVTPVLRDIDIMYYRHPDGHGICVLMTGRENHDHEAEQLPLPEVE